jgi:hypothetical protein
MHLFTRATGLIFSVPKDWKVELEVVGDVLFQSYQKIMD